MLKTTRLPNKSAPSKNNSSRSTFNKNDNMKLAFRKNNGNSEFDRFDIDRNSVKYAKKSGKSKSKIMSKI